MNNEIKEMLEQMESIATTGKSKYGVKVDGYGLQQNELKMFLDYITNLQQRIEGLEAENETLRSDFKNQVEYTNKIAEENERLKENNQNMQIEMVKCWQKIDKAIKYIQQEDWNTEYDYKLLSILQNGSDDK